MKLLVIIVALCASWRVSSLPGQIPEEVLQEEEKRPYSFAWSASRHFNGAPDREHKEGRGEDGVVRGVYRFIDPSNTVQEVVYRADDDGFHVEASNLPRQSEAVVRATNRHLEKFEAIKAQHSRISQELEEKARLAALEEKQPERSDLSGSAPIEIPQSFIDSLKLPTQSAAVQLATDRHFQRFESIRKEHERLGIELEQKKLNAAGAQRQ